jgi:hypothetical protein
VDYSDRAVWAVRMVTMTPAGDLTGAVATLHEGEARGYESGDDLFDVVQAGATDAIVQWSMGYSHDRYRLRLSCAPAVHVIAGRDANYQGTVGSNGVTMVDARPEFVAAWSRPRLAVRSVPFTCGAMDLRGVDSELLGLAAPPQLSRRVITGSRDALATWSELDFATAKAVLHARRIDLQGRTLERMQVPADTLLADDVRFVTDGKDYLAFWTLSIDGRVLIRVGRLAGEGHPAPIGHTIASTYDDRHIDAVWNGSAFIAVWASPNTSVLAARVTADLEILDPGGVEILPPGSGVEHLHRSLAPAPDGTSMLIWSDVFGPCAFPGPGCGRSRAMFGVRLGVDARPLAPPVEIAPYQSDAEAVVWHDGAWSAFWRTRGGASSILSGRRLLADDSMGPVVMVKSVAFGPRLEPFTSGLGVWLLDRDGGLLLDERLERVERVSLPAPLEQWAVLSGAAVEYGKALVIFDMRVPSLPYAGVTRAFVATLDLQLGPSPPPPPVHRRRSVRP